MSDNFAQYIGWFCVHTLPKHEHIAAACLRNADVEVFLPRIRYQRPTKLGRTWVTEALFLNYLFARFDLSSRLRWVHAARGVRAVVHFGTQWPSIPEVAISELRAALGPNDVNVLSRDFKPGQSVEIAQGAFRGLQAVVSHALPAKQRVAILLDFLGRQTTLEVDHAALLDHKDIRNSAGSTVVQPELIAA
jgi:transcriptional antiterminator RfaH